MRQDFGSRLDVEDCRAVVRLDGELDVQAVPEMLRVGRAALGGTGVQRVEVDASGVTFFDCAALGVLITWQNEARRLGIGLGIRSVPPSMRRVFALAGVEPLRASVGAPCGPVHPGAAPGT